MTIKLFDNSSNYSEIKIDANIFVQKPYWRTNFIEANIEEEIDMKNQFRFKNLPDSKSIREVAFNNYVDNIFNIDIDFSDKKIENK